MSLVSGIVADPAPDGAAADLPGFGRPGLDAEVLALVHRIEGLEPGADQHVLVGAGVERLPRELAAAFVERRDPAANAHLAARIADQHFAVGDQRRHGDRLALLDVAELGPPDLLAAVRVDRDRLPVERVEEDLAGVIDRAAVDRVAAGDALRCRERLGLEHPFGRRAGLGQVERVEIVRETA